MSSVTYKSPYRIDLCAGADLRQIAIPFESHHPCAFNFTIDKYINVEVSECGYCQSYDGRYVCINGKTSHIDHMDLMDPDTKLAAYVILALNVSRISVDLHSDLHQCSGLGGSSATMVATISAIHDYMGWSITPRELMMMAHHIENSIPGCNTGLQDQGAAIYSGANLWNIHYLDTHYNKPLRPTYTRDALPEDVYQFLLDRSVLVYTNKMHDSAMENRAQVLAYLNPETRRAWLRTFDVAREFGAAAAKFNTQDCIALMDEMLDIRRGRVTVTSEMAEVMSVASAYQCGVSICGAGGGGYIWLFSDEVDEVVGEIRNTRGLSGCSILELRR